MPTTAHTALPEGACTDAAELRETVMPEYTQLFSIVGFQALVSYLGMDTHLYKSEPKVTDPYIYMGHFFPQTWINEHRETRGKERRGSN